MSQPAKPPAITASMLYDWVQCPERVRLDLFGDHTKCDPTSAFVELLWERGQAYEEQVVQGFSRPFTNLRCHDSLRREELTIEALHRGDGLIYGARLQGDGLLGEPDLLRRSGTAYVAGDIKSGAGLEGAGDDTDGKPKRHYAVQLALYTDLLEQRGFSAGRTAFVWDVHGDEVVYDLSAAQGPRTPQTLWDLYQSALSAVRDIASQASTTLPALSAACKLCHWHTSCLQVLKERDDLTLIAELGRAKRDVMLDRVGTVKALASAHLGLFRSGGKTVFSGIGQDMLAKFKARAQLLAAPGAMPYTITPIALPEANCVLLFDVETDPMRDICYLHGFVARRLGQDGPAPYKACLAALPTPEEERRAFAEAWAYIRSCQPCVVYYYSPYERTTWMKLQRRYPDVASEAEITAFFAAPETVDLYHQIVRPYTQWPTHDYSIKTLASYLGFHWRDEQPSGAASIEWYDEWVREGKQETKERILTYNEDDCVAMGVLADGLRKLSVMS